MNDIRFAFRKLRQSPAFTLIAVITLALGIGLNTAIFSLINDLFLRGLPFKQSKRVLRMYSNVKDRNLLEIGVSAPRYQHYRDGQTMFNGFGAENTIPFTLTGLGDPVQLFGGKVTSNYFDVLGVRPIRGRNFLPQEEDTANVAMVTQNFWRIAKLAVFLDRTERGDLDHETVRDSRILVRTNDARHRFSACDRAIETRYDIETGAGRVAIARSKLPHAISR